ncbi:hypothetical protein NSA02_01745 [Ligilactobacillus murinus]|uniref:hypothetical protein n=1 Tax=Ligilactobacillus murinus TaxID=1622 RepID=UPI00214B8CC4|nr:hypothetical protein [Ligilactobacillus murinus]MCR1895537.1 hypothetical protein [Ligilactobacillus murinus]
MQVDSQKLEKKLQSFADELLALGVKDFVLATSVEIDEGKKVKFQTMLNGDSLTVRSILLNLENLRLEKLRDEIIGG